MEEYGWSFLEPLLQQALNLQECSRTHPKTQELTRSCKSTLRENMVGVFGERNLEMRGGRGWFTFLRGRGERERCDLYHRGFMQGYDGVSWK